MPAAGQRGKHRLGPAPYPAVRLDELDGQTVPLGREIGVTARRLGGRQVLDRLTGQVPPALDGAAAEGAVGVEHEDGSRWRAARWMRGRSGLGWMRA